MSKPTVSQALAALLDAKLVREAGPLQRRARVRPPCCTSSTRRPAGSSASTSGGTGCVPRSPMSPGEFVARRDERARVKSAKTPDHADRRDRTRPGGRCRDPLAAGDVRDRREPRRVRARARTGRARLRLPGWGRQGLVEAVQQELGTKIAFENDVNLAAIGEQWHGLGKGVDNFVYLHLGTGVGMGLVLNGELYRGSGGAAGRGRLPPARPETDLRDPSSRRRGPLDAAGSAAGVVATARRLGMTPPLTAKKVFAEARKGDRKAQAGRAHGGASDRAGDRGGRVGRRSRTGDPGRRHRRRTATCCSSPSSSELRELSPFRPRIEVSTLRRGSHAARLGVDGAAGGAGPAVRTREGVRMNPARRTNAT